MKLILVTQKGLTLVEALLALAAIGILVFAYLWWGGTESAKATACNTIATKVVDAVREHDYEKGIGDQAKIKAACEKLNEQIDKFNNEKCGELEGLNPYQREDCPQ